MYKQMETMRCRLLPEAVLIQAARLKVVQTHRISTASIPFFGYIVGHKTCRFIFDYNCGISW